MKVARRKIGIEKSSLKIFISRLGEKKPTHLCRPVVSLKPGCVRFAAIVGIFFKQFEGIVLNPKTLKRIIGFPISKRVGSVITPTQRAGIGLWTTKKDTQTKSEK
jgi:hypothetical protein